jgi:hypothetical protein
MITSDPFFSSALPADEIPIRQRPKTTTLKLLTIVRSLSNTISTGEGRYVKSSACEWAVRHAPGGK